MSIKISFCIPTYNRGKYLGRLIESITSQWTDEVEIVISDNNSTDNTEEIIAEFQKKYPRIFYAKSETNMGADRNYLRVVELAHGDYCWLFGSDDYLAEGAINRILCEIEDKRDIYLTARMEKNGKRDWLECGCDKVYRLNCKKDIMDYLANANSVGALFSYLSSIIIKRYAWNEVKINEKYIGTAYVHVHMILEMIKNNCGDIKYISQAFPIVGEGGDSFLADGYFKRVMIDLNGYSMLADDYYNSDMDIKKSFLHVMNREHFFSIVTFLRWSGYMSFKDTKKIHEKLILSYDISRIQLLFVKILLPMTHLFVACKCLLNKKRSKSFCI